MTIERGSGRSVRAIKQSRRVLSVAGLAAKVGASYGRSLLARTIGLTSEEADSLRHSRNAARVIETAIALRGPFMKFVQLLGMQGEILPQEYLDALSTLQAQAPPLPWDSIKPMLQAELGRDPEKVFGSFNPDPIAAASLGQVYSAKLPDGTPVAVKVQYPGVREAMETDLKMMRRLLKTQKAVGAGLMRIPGLNYDDVLEDVSSRLREELDYKHEALNIKIFQRIYRDWEWVRVPQVFPEFSTTRVLTMSLVEGTPLGTLLRAGLTEAEKERLHVRLLNMLYHEQGGVGVFHADPHPGNKLIGADGAIHLLDFGCIKIVRRSIRDGGRHVMQALLKGDDKALLEASREMGFYRDGLDPEPALKWWKFAYQPMLADTPFQREGKNPGAQMLQMLSEMAMKGYVHFSPDSVFSLRVFIGAMAIAMMLKVNTVNERRNLVSYFENGLAEGDRIRDELERDGLIQRL